MDPSRHFNKLNLKNWEDRPQQAAALERPDEHTASIHCVRFSFRHCHCYFHFHCHPLCQVLILPLPFPFPLPFSLPLSLCQVLIFPLHCISDIWEQQSWLKSDRDSIRNSCDVSWKLPLERERERANQMQSRKENWQFYPFQIIFAKNLEILFWHQANCGSKK